MVLEDEFIDIVIKELKNLWHECQMVRGSPRHSESNGGIERVNQTVQKKLSGWMKTNNSTHWAIGCKICQWRINTQVHQTLKDTPYHLTYGTHPRVGISNLPVSSDILAKLVTEGELQDVYQQLGSSIVDKDASETSAIAGTDEVGSIFNEVMECGAVDSPDASVPTSSLGKRKKKSPCETSSFTRSMRGAKNIALANAVLLTETREVVPVNPPVNITSPSKGTGKTTGDTPPYVYWFDLIDQQQHPVQLQHMSSAKLNSVFPIIYCFNNKDISDDSNWAPCILRKIRKEQYEVLDMYDDTLKVQIDLDWGGDDGLSSLWGMYYKYPSETFVKSVRIENEIANDDEEAHNVSPRRHTLRTQANANMQKKANSITEKIMKNSPSLIFNVGDVVLVPLDAVDCTKVDGGNLAGVVVSINKAKSTCRVAVQHGLLHRAYVYHVLKPVPESSNNIDVMNLREAYEDWRSLPKITEREAARFISSVGGQGVIHCNCRGSCTTNSCSCRKAGRLCTSRCHRNSKLCQNTHSD
jgi:hypothetical protein